MINFRQGQSSYSGQAEVSRFFSGQVYGNLVDEETRCLHYHNSRDIIALKCYQCRHYYPCYHCHDQCEGHDYKAYPSKFPDFVVLCGKCRWQMTIDEYRLSAYYCPNCQAAFNPGCKDHETIYFKD